MTLRVWPVGERYVVGGASSSDDVTNDSTVNSGAGSVSDALEYLALNAGASSTDDLANDSTVNGGEGTASDVLEYLAGQIAAGAAAWAPTPEFSTVTVTGATATDFYNTEIPANTFITNGQSYRFISEGTFLNTTTAGNMPCTVTFGPTGSPTTVISDSFISTTINANPRFMQSELTLTRISSTTGRVGLRVFISNAGAPAAGVGSLINTYAVLNIGNLSFTADWTVANNIIYKLTPTATATVNSTLRLGGPYLSPGQIGPQGPAGAAGAAGVVGSVWFSGSGVPSDGDGVNGDRYHRTSNGDVYLKAAGTWGSPYANIKGPAGAAGAAGDAVMLQFNLFELSNNTLTPLYLGENPLDVGVTWTKLHLRVIEGNCTVALRRNTTGTTMVAFAGSPSSPWSVTAGTPVTVTLSANQNIQAYGTIDCTITGAGSGGNGLRGLTITLIGVRT